jgi:argininosuccinate lyase
MKLWQKKGSTTSSLVEQFTVGRDKEFDIELAKYDVIGSMAHCRMLHKVGLLKKQELTLILKALQEIKLEIENKKFKIEKGIEDIHSQVEKLVTERYGEVFKIILSRSDNTNKGACQYIVQSFHWFSKKTSARFIARIYTLSIGNALIIWFVV